MFNKLSSSLFINKINEEFLLETKLNDTQFLIEYEGIDEEVKYMVDSYSASWYPDVYEYIGSL